MVERADASLSPRAMREIAETDWTDTGTGGTVERTEQHAKQIFALFVEPLRASRDPDAENRASEWTVGALVGAFPRANRPDIRTKVRELVERVVARILQEALLSRETVTEQVRIAKSVERQARKKAKKGRTK
jgi:hypothetical protein